VLAAPLINEYFGVGVTSEAMDGAAPELNQDGSPTEKHPL